jgi:ubiquinone/menaquinone biosynthesis C-methylase UbiE
VAVTGIDISEDMIKNASRRNHAAVQQGRVVFALGDCCDLQFPDGTFDAVTGINTIYFWRDTIKGIQILFKKGLCFRWEKSRIFGCDH